MFAWRHKGTVIAKGLKIVGCVTAEGLVEINGEIEGELHGTSLVITQGANVIGTITAQRVVVDGDVEGPIHGTDVILKSHANVVGNIRHQSLSIESGAKFEGLSTRALGAEGQEAERMDKKPLRERNREISSAAE
jgi:cytoskeletal protein CcmA (bactofilin family)